MGRRRERSQAKAIFEAISAGASLFVLLWFFSPEFRQWITFILVTMVFLSVAVVITWLMIREFKKEPTKSSCEAISFNPQAPSDSRVNYTSQVAIPAEPQTIRPVPELTISQKLRNIDWFQFEKLVELIYQYRGFSVKRLGGAKPDGGVDLIVESPTEKFVVQCKHWHKWTVGVRQIREFLGALTDSGIPKGIFITLVGYSGDAKLLADKHGIQILNETDVVKMLEDAGLMYSKEISELFSDTRKFCPKCESEMILRTARVKGNKFWGCSNYPRCRFILDYDA